jgi:hypothetical protein
MPDAGLVGGGGQQIRPLSWDMYTEGAKATVSGAVGSELKGGRKERSVGNDARGEVMLVSGVGEPVPFTGRRSQRKLAPRIRAVGSWQAM